MKRAVIIALVLMAGGFLLMGAPGYALYLAGDLPFGSRLGSFHGDETWSIAIFMNLLWPPGIPLLFWWLRPRLARPTLFWPALLVLLCVWAVLLATMLHWNAASLSGG